MLCDLCRISLHRTCWEEKQTHRVRADGCLALARVLQGQSLVAAASNSQIKPARWCNLNKMTVRAVRGASGSVPGPAGSFPIARGESNEDAAAHADITLDSRRVDGFALVSLNVELAERCRGSLHLPSVGLIRVLFNQLLLQPGSLVHPDYSRTVGQFNHLLICRGDTEETNISVCSAVRRNTLVDKDLRCHVSLPTKYELFFVLICQTQKCNPRSYRSDAACQNAVVEKLGVTSLCLFQGDSRLHRCRPPRVPHVCDWAAAKWKVRLTRGWSSRTNGFFFFFLDILTHKASYVYAPSFRLKNVLSQKVHLMCYRICVRALTAIITYHDR